MQRLCKICTAQFSHNIWGEPPRICLHKFCAFFGQDLNFSLRLSCTGKSTLNCRPSLSTLRSVRKYEYPACNDSENDGNLDAHSIANGNRGCNREIVNCLTFFRKGVMSIKFPPVILGPEMAAPILWAPGIFWFFLLENPKAHKIPPFRGGFWVFLEGGVEVPILFLWAWGFFRIFAGIAANCSVGPKVAQSQIMLGC